MNTKETCTYCGANRADWEACRECDGAGYLDVGPEDDSDGQQECPMCLGNGGYTTCPNRPRCVARYRQAFQIIEDADGPTGLHELMRRTVSDQSDMIYTLAVLMRHEKITMTPDWTYVLTSKQARRTPTHEPHPMEDEP